MNEQSPHDRFRSKLNYFLSAGVGAFLIFFTLASVQWYRINGGLIETKFFPVFEYLTMDDWERNPTGQWSAVVTFEKFRPECVYVSGQIETVLGDLLDGDTKESTISFIGDTTPGNNRPTGVQQLDQRVQIDDPEFVPGTKFWGTVLHRCHSGSLTVTEFGPFIIGQNGPSVDRD